MSDSVRPHRRQPNRLHCPWDSPGKNTGVGCHFLLQCRKVKSEREVTQLCLTLRDPMDCSPPGSSIHGIFQARIPEWIALPSSRGSSLPRDRTLVSYVSCIGRQVLKLWKILREMGIPDQQTCLLRNLYAGQEATVRTGHGTIDWF